MKDRAVATRADPGVVNVVRCHAPFGQQSGREAGQIDVWFGAAPIDEQVRLGIRRAKLFDDLLPHFEAADTDGRSKPCLRSGSVKHSFHAENVERLRCDLLHRAAPAGMNIGDHAMINVGNRDRETVRL